MSHEAHPLIFFDFGDFNISEKLTLLKPL